MRRSGKTISKSMFAAVLVCQAELLAEGADTGGGALSAATLQDLGYKNAKFIAGGLNAYRKLG
jgi:hypothetical protein